MDSENNIVVYGYREIYGTDGGGLERIKREMSNYNLYAALMLLSQMEHQLLQDDPIKVTAQNKLIKEFFDKPIIQKIANIAAQHRQEDGRLRKQAIFSQQQILILFKLALESCSPNEGIDMTGDNFTQIGTWCLIVNDVITAVARQVPALLTNPNDPELESVRQYMARQGFYYAHSSLVGQWVRYYRIYQIARTVPEAKRLHPHKYFPKATNGVGVDSYLAIIFPLIAQWAVQHQPYDLKTEWFIVPESKFSKTTLQKRKLQRVMDFLSIDATDFPKHYKSLLQETMSDIDNYAYNFLAFSAKPLLKGQDRLICPSPQHLVDRVTEGLYWILENYFKVNKMQTERAAWSSIWGQAFERYINRRLKSALGQQYYANWPNLQHEKADGIWDADKMVFIFEIKYAHWQVKAKATGSRQDMAPTLKQLFSSSKKAKGLGQVARNLDQLAQGKWSLPSPLNGRRIVPVLVVGEEMPIEPLNRYYYDEVAKNAGAIPGSQLADPFIILTAEDIELLETLIVKKGALEAEKILTHFAQLHKTINANGFRYEARAGFKNFLFANKLVDFDNAYIKAEYDKIGAHVKQKLFKRSR